MKNYLMLLSTHNEENSDVFLIYNVSKSKEQAKNEFKIQKAERKLQF